MEIILRETEWTQQMIESHSLGKYPEATLRRVARYRLDQGYSKDKTIRLLEEFILRCDQYASLTAWMEPVERAVKYASKHPAINIDCITITQSELDIINALPRRPVRRLAFTALCLAKYHMAVDPECDFWVGEDMNDIMALANIKTSMRRQCEMYRELEERGLIQLSRRIDSMSFKVCFATEGEVTLEIEDFFDLGNRYLMYCGEPFFECAGCGRIVKYQDPKNKRRQKYCRACAADMLTEQRRAAVSKCRYQKQLKA